MSVDFHQNLHGIDLIQVFFAANITEFSQNFLFFSCQWTPRLEKEREINISCLGTYLPDRKSQLPALVDKKNSKSDFSSEREILYKVLFDMKGDLNDLKKLTLELLKDNDSNKVQRENEGLIRKIYGNQEEEVDNNALVSHICAPCMCLICFL